MQGRLYATPTCVQCVLKLQNLAPDSDWARGIVLVAAVAGRVERYWALSRKTLLSSCAIQGAMHEFVLRQIPEDALLNADAIDTPRFASPLPGTCSIFLHWVFGAPAVHSFSYPRPALNIPVLPLFNSVP